MNLLIFTSLLGYSRHIVIDDEPFIRSTRKKKKNSTTHYTIYKISHLI